MTGIKVRQYVGDDALRASGDLEGSISLFRPVSFRVSFSDGTITRWDCVNDKWVCTIIVKGELLDIVSVGDKTDELFFRTGLKWVIAYCYHYDIISNRETKERHYRECMTKLETIGDTDDGQHDHETTDRESDQTDG